MIPRRQLTLFVSGSSGTLIDSVRLAIDPLQYAKIRSHITLCYDDELRDLPHVIERLSSIPLSDIYFDFAIGSPRTFEAEEKGIYLTTVDTNGRYNLMREQLLGNSSSRRRGVGPHITLLHPRHACDATDGWEIVKFAKFPESMRTGTISLIEFDDIKWNVVCEFGANEQFGGESHRPKANGH